jgi:hypothetical protein
MKSTRTFYLIQNKNLESKCCAWLNVSNFLLNINRIIVVYNTKFYKQSIVDQRATDYDFKICLYFPAHCRAVQPDIYLNLCWLGTTYTYVLPCRRLRHDSCFVSHMPYVWVQKSKALQGPQCYYSCEQHGIIMTPDEFSVTITVLSQLLSISCVAQSPVR